MAVVSLQRTGKIYISGESIIEKYCKAEYVQPRVCFVNVQLSLHENVVFSVCALMCNAVYVIFIMWNSISGLDTWYHFWFNISCGVAVKVRSHQEKFQVIVLRGGEGGRKFFWRGAPIFKVIFIFLVILIFYVVFIFLVVFI